MRRKVANQTQETISIIFSISSGQINMKIRSNAQMIKIFTPKFYSVTYLEFLQARNFRVQRKEFYQETKKSAFWYNILEESRCSLLFLVICPLFLVFVIFKKKCFQKQ